MNVPMLIRYPGHIEARRRLTAYHVEPRHNAAHPFGPLRPRRHDTQGVEGRDYQAGLTDRASMRPCDGALYIRNSDGDRDSLGNVISYFPVARGIKTDRYTLALTIDKRTGELKSSLLFDDMADPYQMVNLPLDENKEIVADLCRRMVPLLRAGRRPLVFASHPLLTYPLPRQLTYT